MRGKVDIENAIQWIEKNCRIQDATGPGTVPAILTDSQKIILRNSPALRLERDTSVTWKPRQIGSSTAVLCLISYLMFEFPGISIAWLSKAHEDHKKFRRKWNIIIESLMNSSIRYPYSKRDSEDEYQLSNGSTLVWSFAGKTERKASDAGRGDTFHLLIATELAFFENAQETMDSICPALERAGMPIFIDSTPNEMEGDGSTYYEYAMNAYNSVPGFTLVCLYWWDEDQYRINLSESQRASVMLSLSEHEKFLVDEFKLVPEQIAWRRNKVALHKDKFTQIYPEDFIESFCSNNEDIFKPETIRAISSRFRRNEISVPEPAEKIELAMKAAGIEHYGVEDVLLNSKYGEKNVGTGYFRVWKMPEDVAGNVYVGADCSQGTPDGDWQSAVFTDDLADIVAILRTKERCVEVYADALARACKLFDAFLTIEDEKYGAVLYKILSTPQDQGYLKSIGLGTSLNKPFVKMFSEDGSGLRAMTQKTRPMVVKTFISYINEGYTEINDDIMFSEMSTLTMASGRIEHRRGCHDDSLFALGHSLMTRNLIMTSSKIVSVNTSIMGDRNAKSGFNGAGSKLYSRKGNSFGGEQLSSFEQDQKHGNGNRGKTERNGGSIASRVDAFIGSARRR